MSWKLLSAILSNGWFILRKRTLFIQLNYYKLYLYLFLTPLIFLAYNYRRQAVLTRVSS